MVEEEMKKVELECCCISHAFFKTATENPRKIGVIHASGGAKIIKRRRAECRVSGELWEEFSAARSSESPPIYHGDSSYTYSEILASVESAAARIQNVLDGGDDACLIKPHNLGVEVGKGMEMHVLSDFRSMGQSCSEEDHYFPKIVGLYMVPSVEYIVSVLAVLRCREAFVPLDPLWPRERILSINVDLIIGSHGVLDSGSGYQIDAEHWLVRCGCAPVLCVSLDVGALDPIGLSPIPWPCERKKQRPFCYVLYTSGSTGKPKGVCGTEIGLLNRFLWMQESYPLSTDEVLLFKTSISFTDHLQEILGPLLTATTVIIPPLSMMKENLFHMVDIVQVYKISRLVCVPTLIKLVLPALRDVSRCLRLLILSGEIFPMTLWESLNKILPRTTVLNLYGSTEVSGDCTYFDCKKLPEILKTENLRSVPIGQPLHNCQVILDGSDDGSMRGEIRVGGYCISSGYISSSSNINSDVVRLTDDSTKNDSIDDHENYHYYFRTGDFARRLESNDLIFEGRKDRTLKVNGKRIALEEIENTLRAHPDVVDAAVLCGESSSNGAQLEAHLVMNQQYESDEIPLSLIHHWMVDKLPMEMIPNFFYFSQSFPMTSTGKVDYVSLGARKPHVQTNDAQSRLFLQKIKEAFSAALKEDKVSGDDDFFLRGGNSIAAAHAAHLLDIDMRLLYMFPTPLKLQEALSNKEEAFLFDRKDAVNWELKRNTEKQDLPVFALNATGHSHSLKRKTMPVQCEENETHSAMSECKKLKSHIGPGDVQRDWVFSPKLVPCSLSRCNKTMFERNNEVDTAEQVLCIEDIPESVGSSIKHLWKVDMESCVDASPIVVCKNESIYLFIGSHSHKFSCINAISGSVEWNVVLNGRIESSAVVVGDFSQVVVGCYDGNIYFLDFFTGSLCWSFQTGAEVKCQPVVDTKRHLIWCGSHDHYLYALDYENHVCVHMHPCGGSIFGSPAIDEAFDIIYVASTSGFVLAISIKDIPLSNRWQHDFGAPIFGSLGTSSNGLVICCLVDGRIVALDSTGQPVWKFKTGGPVFAGPSVSHALPSQVLVCCRSGRIYSLKQETGSLLWDYNIGDPITASAYVDEYLQMACDSSLDADRLLCACSSSGIVQVLRICSNAGVATPSRNIVKEFAMTLLDGDIFSSPVMVAGRIFVGCRDDYLHCLAVGTQGSVPVPE